MRKSVGFPEGYDEGVTDFKVTPHVVLQVNLPIEAQRVAWCHDLLEEFAVRFPSGDFKRVDNSRFVAGRCFANSTLLAGKDGMVYCEGVLRGRDPSGCPISMVHAWCFHIPSWTVYDPTMGLFGAPDGMLYVGIPFNSVYVHERSHSSGFFGVTEGHPSFGDQWGAHIDPPAHWLHPCWHKLERYGGPF